MGTREGKEIGCIGGVYDYKVDEVGIGKEVVDEYGTWVMVLSVGRIGDLVA